MKKRSAVQRKTSKSSKIVKAKKGSRSARSTRKTKTKKSSRNVQNTEKQPRQDTLSIQQDIASLLTMLVQKLTSFETKLDTVVSRIMAQPLDTPSKPLMPSLSGERRRQGSPLYKAVCADCQRDCEVPFKPSGTRPVYCRDCYAKRKHTQNFNSSTSSNVLSDSQLGHRIKLESSVPNILQPPPKPSKIQKISSPPHKKQTVKKKKKATRKK